MLENQRFTHDIFPEDGKPLDFSQEDDKHEKQRQNAVDCLKKLQAGEVAGISDEDKATSINCLCPQMIYRMHKENG